MAGANGGRPRERDGDDGPPTKRPRDAPATQHSRVLAVVNSAMSTFCTMNAVRDIPAGDARGGEEVTLRIELSGERRQRLVLEQCVPLRELLAELAAKQRKDARAAEAAETDSEVEDASAERDADATVPRADANGRDRRDEPNAADARRGETEADVVVGDSVPNAESARMKPATTKKTTTPRARANRAADTRAIVRGSIDTVVKDGVPAAKAADAHSPPAQPAGGRGTPGSSKKASKKVPWRMDEANSSSASARMRPADNWEAAVVSEPKGSPARPAKSPYRDIMEKTIAKARGPPPKIDKPARRSAPRATRRGRKNAAKAVDSEPEGVQLSAAVRDMLVGLTPAKKAAPATGEVSNLVDDTDAELPASKETAKGAASASAGKGGVGSKTEKEIVPAPGSAAKAAATPPAVTGGGGPSKEVVLTAKVAAKAAARSTAKAASKPAKTSSEKPLAKPDPKPPAPQMAPEALRAHLSGVLEALMKHKSAWPFLAPVDPAESGATDYYKVIKKPIDLLTMKGKLEAGGTYVSPDVFEADFRRMVKNCRKYNGNGHFVTKMALTLEKVFVKKMGLGE